MKKNQRFVGLTWALEWAGGHMTSVGRAGALQSLGTWECA